ncbi:hypothetical protein PCE1_002742 [Barthelona sp. PCE]
MKADVLLGLFNDSASQRTFKRHEAGLEQLFRERPDGYYYHELSALSDLLLELKERSDVDSKISKALRISQEDCDMYHDCLQLLLQRFCFKFQKERLSCEIRHFKDTLTIFNTLSVLLTEETLRPIIFNGIKELLGDKHLPTAHLTSNEEHNEGTIVKAIGMSSFLPVLFDCELTEDSVQILRILSFTHCSFQNYYENFSSLVEKLKLSEEFLNSTHLLSGQSSYHFFLIEILWNIVLRSDFLGIYMLINEYDLHILEDLLKYFLQPQIFYRENDMKLCVDYFNLLKSIFKHFYKNDIVFNELIFLDGIEMLFLKNSMASKETKSKINLALKFLDLINTYIAVYIDVVKPNFISSLYIFLQPTEEIVRRWGEFTISKLQRLLCETIALTVSNYYDFCGSNIFGALVELLKNTNLQQHILSMFAFVTKSSPLNSFFDSEDFINHMFELFSEPTTPVLDKRVCVLIIGNVYQSYETIPSRVLPLAADIMLKLLPLFFYSPLDKDGFVTTIAETLRVFALGHEKLFDAFLKNGGIQAIITLLNSKIDLEFKSYLVSIVNQFMAKYTESLRKNITSSVAIKTQTVAHSSIFLTLLNLWKENPLQTTYLEITPVDILRLRIVNFLSYFKFKLPIPLNPPHRLVLNHSEVFNALLEHRQLELGYAGFYQKLDLAVPTEIQAFLQFLKTTDALLLDVENNSVVVESDDEDDEDIRIRTVSENRINTPWLVASSKTANIECESAELRAMQPKIDAIKVKRTELMDLIDRVLEKKNDLLNRIAEERKEDEQMYYQRFIESMSRCNSSVSSHTSEPIKKSKFTANRVVPDEVADENPISDEFEPVLPKNEEEYIDYLLDV